MQQTTKYKLNLIKKTDTFSPDPLNENMEKVEGALGEGLSALDQRVTALEVKKIVFGTYQAGQTQINLGFTPVAVLAMGNHPNCSRYSLAVRNSPVDGTALKIVENGFSVSGLMTSSFKFNYIAFA